MQTPRRAACLMLAALVMGPAAGRSEETPKSFVRTEPRILTELDRLHEAAGERMRREDFSAAIRLYTEIILIEPDDDAAYTNLGQCYLVLGDSTRAREAFQNALDINADNAVAIAGLRHLADPDAPILLDAPDGAEEIFREETAAVSEETPVFVSAAEAAPPVLVTALQSSAACPRPSESALPAVQSPGIPDTPRAPLLAQPLVPAAPQMIAPPSDYEPPQTVAPVTEPPDPVMEISRGTPPLPAPAAQPPADDAPTFNELAQLALKQAGFYGGPIDGKFGPASREAVTRFQKSQALEADGLIGPKTWSRLKAYLPVKKASGSGPAV